MSVMITFDPSFASISPIKPGPEPSSTTRAPMYRCRGRDAAWQRGMGQCGMQMGFKSCGGRQLPCMQAVLPTYPFSPRYAAKSSSPSHRQAPTPMRVAFSAPGSCTRRTVTPSAHGSVTWTSTAECSIQRSVLSRSWACSKNWMYVGCVPMWTSS
eukprot:356411-Chlamydomonas_euryale.AAC.6